MEVVGLRFRLHIIVPIVNELLEEGVSKHNLVVLRQYLLIKVLDIQVTSVTAVTISYSFQRHEQILVGRRTKLKLELVIVPLVSEVTTLII